MNDSLGTRVGYLNPLLYRLTAERTSAAIDIVEGCNGAYRAGPGWDACSGVGAPHGIELLAALRGG